MEANIAKRKRDFCNLHLCGSMDFAGRYDMPQLNPCHCSLPDRFLPFNQALSTTDFDSGVHFFIDDYQFERVWRLPERYLPILKRFQCVVAPDFSMFIDVPLAVNIWNIYRNRVIARWLQDNGVQVIPSVSWGNSDTLAFCFDGLPKDSIMAVGHTACGRNKSQRNQFIQHLYTLIEQKKPSLLVVYGKPFEIDYHNVKFVEDRISKLKQHGKRKPS
ncbi:MAG: DUF4417 domain-containing protein [Bacteroidales bacterium]|nr:DUF4417 domain-containing protein [Bacteroidales bacterium]